jgi:hypothetical protein
MAWAAMAGKHTFVVPDEHQARALADAFVSFGYPACLRIAVAQAPRDEEAGPGRHHRGE